MNVDCCSLPNSQQEPQSRQGLPFQRQAGATSSRQHPRQPDHTHSSTCRTDAFRAHICFLQRRGLCSFRLQLVMAARRMWTPCHPSDYKRQATKRTRRGPGATTLRTMAECCAGLLKPFFFFIKANDETTTRVLTNQEMFHLEILLRQ